MLNHLIYMCYKSEIRQLISILFYSATIAAIWLKLASVIGQRLTQVYTHIVSLAGRGALLGALFVDHDTSDCPFAPMQDRRAHRPLPYPPYTPSGAAPRPSTKSRATAICIKYNNIMGTAGMASLANSAMSAASVREHIPAHNVRWIRDLLLRRTTELFRS